MAYFVIVLTRDALEKLNKEELLSLFVENDDKLTSSMANLTNQLAEVNKTLSRMESRLEISKTINNILEKRITSLEKQCWRNKQYSRRECVEIVEIPDSTNEMWTDWKGYWYKCKSRLPRIVSPATLREKNKIIVIFSRRKDAESVLWNKNKNKNFNPQNIDTDSKKVFINESFCRYYKFLWSKCKTLWTKKWIKAFWVGNGQIKLRIEPEGSVSRVSHIQELQKLLPDYYFQSD